MASRPEQLYDDDFYAWARHQAAELRKLAATRPNAALDFPHLIEEVADLGTSERNAVRSDLRVIIEHLLKLEYAPAVDPRPGWYETIIRARDDLDDRLTPTLQRDLQRNLAKVYARACRATRAKLRLHGEHEAAEALPDACPWRLTDLLNPDWFPKSRHGHQP
jgi:hypothetical protein